MIEMHIVIDWYQKIGKEILIKEIKLRKLNLYEIKTIEPLKNRDKALHDFYGHDMAPKTYGGSNFDLYFILDEDPIYDFRNTSTGYRKVNTKIFDMKFYIRNTLKQAIHGTDNIEETKRNLQAFNLYEYYKPRNFRNFEDFFNTLNNTNLQYYLISYELIENKFIIPKDTIIKINTNNKQSFINICDMRVENNIIRINNIDYKFIIYNNYKVSNISNEIRINNLLNILKQNNISIDDVCIVGSFSLQYYNIRKAGDIDVIISKKVQNYKEIVESNNFEIDWYYNISDNDIIYDSKYHIVMENGLKILRLEYLLNWKKFNKKRKLLSCKEKDLNDLILFKNKILKL